MSFRLIGLTACWLDIHKPPRQEEGDRVSWFGPCERCGTVIPSAQPAPHPIDVPTVERTPHS